jgi:hypothetical protein
MTSHIRASFAACLAAVVLIVAPSAAHAEPVDAERAKRVVDVRVPDEGVTQRLTLTDGSQIFGRVESIEGDALVFRSLAGVELRTSRAEVSDLRVVSGRVRGGEFQPTDTHNTRLLFAPTGRALRKGEGYFGVYEVNVPFVQVGVTNRLSLGGGTPLWFGGGSEHPFWFTPKLQVLATPRAQAAVGVIHISGFEHSAGIAYGVTTVGTPEQAVSVGLGYAYGEGERAPILMIGGEYRASRRIKWVTENWLSRGGNGFVSGGIRFLGERLSADFGLIAPLVDAEGFYAYPLVSFAWHF